MSRIWTTRSVENGPIAELSTKPNPKLTDRAYRRALSAFLDLFGIAYHINFVASDRSEVLGYTVRSPLEITEMKDRTTGEVMAYKYRPIGTAGGQEIMLSADDVQPVVDPDYGSGDLSRPLSARRAAGLAIRQYWKADVSNDRSLEHGASGGMGLRTEQNLTGPQKKDLIAQLRERNSGYKNRHHWMLLEGGLTIERLFNSFQEMEFSQLKSMSREDICVAFGLNTIVVGYQPTGGLGSGQTLEAAHLVVWTDTHLPRAEWLAQEWCEAVITPFDRNVSLRLKNSRRRSMRPAERKDRSRREAAFRAQASGSKFYAWFDSSGVPILQRYALELAKQAGEWIEKGVPLNQVLRAYDLPFEEVDWGDTWWRQAGLVDVQDTTPIIDDPTGSDPVEPEPDDDLDPGDSDDETESEERAMVLREVSEDELASLWEAWRLSWAGLDKATRSKVSRHFSELWRQVRAKLDQVLPDGKSGGAVVQRDAAAEILFDLQEANQRLIVLVGPLLREAMRLGGNQAMTEHARATGQDKADPFNLDDPGVVAALRRRELELTGVNRTLRRQVRDQIVAGMTAGETHEQITARVKKTFGAATSRSSTIARTEVGRSVEEARQLGRGQAGTPLKSWLWSRRETGRAWHRQAEAETLATPIPNTQKFRLPKTGNTCDHPRATGSPEDDINCGCTTIARFPGDSIRSAVGLYQTRGFLTYEQLIERATPGKAA